MDKTKVAVAVFDKWAKEYRDRFMDFDLYNDTFDLFCGHVAKENATVLDVACGPGNITRYLLKRRPNLRILGIDLAPNMIDLARSANPGAEFRLMDGRNIRSLGATYDALMCGFFLPYLSREEAIEFISNASEVLEPGGILYLSTMEDDYAKSGIQRSSYGDEAYIHYHQADYLTEALLKNGFHIIHLQRKDFPGQDGKKTIDLVILAGK